VVAQSFGLAPTGTFTFSLDGKALAGSISYIGTAPCGTRTSTVCLQAQTSTSIPSGGSHTITATYNGDANYTGSTLSTSVTASYATTTILSANPLNPQPGAAVTLTALVDTPAKNLAPTGNVTFSSLPGTPVLTPVTDANGNSALQATLDFTPSSNSTSLQAVYGGDANFDFSFSNFITITLAGNDFSLSAYTSGFTSLHPGQSGSVGVVIDGQASYNGTITFAASSCSGLPSETSCSFNPASVTGSGTANMTVSTTAPHALVNHAGFSGSWTTPFGIALAGIVLCGMPTRRRRYRVRMRDVSLLLCIAVGMGCGGGSSNPSGGSGAQTDPGTPVGTYTVTVTGTSGTLSHTATFTLIVQ
jgi:hypothetical protein